MVFSARTGGNLSDLASELFAEVFRLCPEAEDKIQIIEVARYKVEPCNGCRYECLLGKESGYMCPISDDVVALWRLALASKVLVYFVPAYGGMPPATWVAFRQRYHALLHHQPEALATKDGVVAAVTISEPLGTKAGDVSQTVIRHSLAGGSRPLIFHESIVPSDYGLNSLRDRLVSHPAILARLHAAAQQVADAVKEPSGV